MRLIKWMMIGELMSKVPAAIAQGFMNRSNISESPNPRLRFALAASGQRARNASKYWLSRRRRRPVGHAVVQEFRQHRVEVITRLDQGVIDADARRPSANLDQKFLQRLDVAVSQRPRVAQQIRQLFHPFEASRAGKWKVHLVVV